MIRITAILTAVLAASSVSLSAETRGVISKRALHFRLEVGVGDVRTMSGWIDESGGTGHGYDRLALDFDGDGRADVTSSFEPTDPESDVWTWPTISFRHESARWTLELNDSVFEPAVAPSDSIEHYFGWSVFRGNRYAVFINGPMRLYTTAKAAAKGRAVRLGPPFRLECGVKTRGHEVLLSAALRDGNGCTLRLAWSGARDENIRVGLLDRKGASHLRPMEYG